MTVIQVIYVMETIIHQRDGRTRAAVVTNGHSPSFTDRVLHSQYMSKWIAILKRQRINISN